VQLALAVARKILHREPARPPCAGRIVRSLSRGWDARTKVSLAVPPCDAAEWRNSLSTQEASHAAHADLLWCASIPSIVTAQFLQRMGVELASMRDLRATASASCTTSVSIPISNSVFERKSDHAPRSALVPQTAQRPTRRALPVAPAGGTAPEAPLVAAGVFLRHFPHPLDTQPTASLGKGEAFNSASALELAAQPR